MDIENYMKDINRKITDTHYYKDLFDFIQADIVFKDEDEYQNIIKSYKKAKQKKYIKIIIDSGSDSKINLRAGKDFTFIRSKNSENNKPINTNINNTNRRNNNSNNNNNNWRSNNNNNRNNNRKLNNNFHNHRIFSGRDNTNNNNYPSNNDRNNDRKRNNFNSHMYDLDELFGE
jgi:hypothetical protein